MNPIKYIWILVDYMIVMRRLCSSNCVGQTLGGCENEMFSPRLILTTRKMFCYRRDEQQKIRHWRIPEINGHKQNENKSWMHAKSEDIHSYVASCPEKACFFFLKPLFDASWTTNEIPLPSVLGQKSNGWYPNTSADKTRVIKDGYHWGKYVLVEFLTYFIFCLLFHLFSFSFNWLIVHKMNGRVGGGECQMLFCVIKNFQFENWEKLQNPHVVEAEKFG